MPWADLAEAVSGQRAFERVLAALYDAMLDDTHWFGHLGPD